MSDRMPSAEKVVPPCDVCGKRSTTADGTCGAYLCDDTACFFEAWDRAFAQRVTPPEAHPCGHADRVRGCGGCDPGAIEFVRDDGGPWTRIIPPAKTSIDATEETPK